MKICVNINSACYGKKQILSDVSFSANQGFTAIIGKNGSGKSTLLSCIDGLMSFDGEITIESQNIKSMSKREIAKSISMMHQIPNIPHIKVKDLVSFGRNPYLQMGQKLQDADMEIIKNAIEITGLSELSDCFLDRISGGESRRAYLAMMLAQDSPLMLLDEATAFMDKDCEKQFISILKKLCREKGKTVLFAMHDLSLAMNIADNVLLLDKGRRIFFGEKDELSKQNLIEDIFSAEKYESKNKDGIKNVFYY